MKPFTSHLTYEFSDVREKLLSEAEGGCGFCENWPSQGYRIRVKFKFIPANGAILNMVLAQPYLRFELPVVQG